MKKLEFANYDFSQIENKIKSLWKNNNIASHSFSNAKPFTIVIPPPNVTGHLHIGHAWDGIIQDAIIRYKRLQHFNSLWIPGTDHAGIATQVKFENYLKANKINKHLLGKEKFLCEIFKWKDQQSNFIHEQWDQLGFLLDYSNEHFTLDDKFTNAVLYAFVRLYKANLIYEGYRLVNWDPILKTAISDIEVIYKDAKSKFYYIIYDVINEKKQIIDQLLVATTRPETMFGDVCLVVNPNDIRYKKYINLFAINPANNQPIKIIADNYVDLTFGTGVMKCTPAHDFNDYKIAKTHNLKMINILNDDATLNNNCPKEFQNLSILSARNLLIKQLEEKEHIHHIEDINNRIGYSERTGEIIQPYLTKQWFLKTSELAKDVIKTQESNHKVTFLPQRFDSTLMHWLLNMEDWCISRQLWWGHQLPIWYHKETNEIYCDVNEPIDAQNWTRSNDVLDTWFSSGLWPMITLGWDGLSNKINNNRFPTQILVTGYDIIFFWIARMMMFSSYFLHESPFEYAYIHGLVKDEKNRKMSKSLGNGIEPSELIKEYGNDAIRIFFLSDCASGEDISYKPMKLKQAFNFLIKLWNTAKFIEIKEFIYDPNFTIDYSKNNAIENYMLNELIKTSDIVKTNLDKYSFNIAYKYLNNFIWDKFCNFYLEIMKYQDFNNLYSKKLFMYIWKYVLIMLQTFTPFISEYLYQIQIQQNKSILLEDWLCLNKNDSKINDINIVDIGLLLLSKIRQARTNFNIAKTIQLILHIDKINQAEIEIINKIIQLTNAKIDNNISLNGKYIIVINEYKFLLDIDNLLINEYIEKLNNQINKLKNEIQRSEKILSNEAFMKKASEEKINEEKNKYAQYSSELRNLIIEINELKEK